MYYYYYFLVFLVAFSSFGMLMESQKMKLQLVSYVLELDLEFIYLFIWFPINTSKTSLLNSGQESRRTEMCRQPSGAFYVIVRIQS